MARFIRQGKAKFYFLPAVAGYSSTGATIAPTAPEVTAGTELTPQIAAAAGWQIEGARVDVPDMATRFAKNIPGLQSVGDSSFTFYADDTADAIRTALPVDTAGFIYAVKGTGKADLFPVRVLSVGDEYAIGNEPARYTIGFAITDKPASELTAA